ncbi:methyl-accepting chemotaxis protein [Oleiphilus messinensis]|uniref:Methyl-accepting chemotaxis protein n=2 Tax=Oleiphilus messinensis TaxID=141451 RepID=A0A1Y0IC57_9GAMM|nr:methyl-accepting chemotaxis protein [Oleiphilus messinensis]
MSLRTKLSIVTAVPIFMVLVLSSMLCSTALEESIQAELTLEVVDVIGILDRVAHQHAVERGLTAGFMGSKGESGRDRLLGQREVADEAESALRELLNSRESRYDWLNSTNIQQLGRLLDKKQAVRNKVDQLDPTATPFDYYSKVNDIALMVIEESIKQVESGSVYRQLDSLHNILWLKERAGQSRGKLNGVYARKSASIASYSDIAHYIADFDARFQSLKNDQIILIQTLVNELVQKPVFAQIEKIEASFAAQSDSLSAIKGPPPSEWFPLATDRIKVIKQLADAMSEKSKGLASQAHNAALARLYTIVVVAVVLIGLVSFAALNISRNLIKGVRKILHVFEEVTVKNNLKVRSEVDSKDEIGDISTKLDGFLVWFENLILELNASVVQLKTAAVQFSERSRSNKSLVDEQNRDAQSVSSAITEMSASINEVASATSSASELSIRSREHSESGLKHTRETVSAVHKLTENLNGSFELIQELARNSQNIGSILDTIRGIAEQTNLLALNAAIEAARAGEAGRGFAVVADEVRGLASRTQDSTEEIQTMIETLQNNAAKATHNMKQGEEIAQRSVQSVESSGQMIAEIHQNISDVNERFLQISAAAEEQSSVSGEIAGNIESIAHKSDDILSVAREVEQSGVEVSRVSDLIQQKIAHFH